MKNTLDLINQVELYAQSVTATTGLPVSAAQLQQYAATFAKIYKPQLVENEDAIDTFSKNYGSVRNILHSKLEVWEVGDTEASSTISTILNEQVLALTVLIKNNSDVSDDLIKYRHSILEKQQNLNGEVNRLQGELKTTQERLASKKDKRDDLIKRQIALAFFPLAYLTSQVINLIKDQKLVEQEIVELSGQTNRIADEVAHLNYVLNVVNQFSESVNTLVGGLQSLFNALNFANSYMNQACQSAKSGGEATIAILVKAYISAFEEQMKLFN